MSRWTISNVSEIIELFKKRGDSEYGGEDVTQLQHALQTAQLAEKENSTAELVVAALLHDFGHLLHDLPDDAPDLGVDDFHETAAESSLSSLFPLAVTEPIKLHVQAKRFLCSTDRSYNSKLSEASITSLELQGGRMSVEELMEFKSHTHWRDAIRLRIWDDLAKDPELETPLLDYYIDFLERASL
ncbi:MAG: metal-dependent phosphohydrolase [Planctomycetaceae bacterium]|nr:metal-dependent phosphohydrolase [Planctomycetaceae bacterium]|tara:strand:+ start:2676 stop:3233 length:558 start_codon:yes stop_codon:yes gene_type:complete